MLWSLLCDDEQEIDMTSGSLTKEYDLGQAYGSLVLSSSHTMMFAGAYSFALLAPDSEAAPPCVALLSPTLSMRK